MMARMDKLDPANLPLRTTLHIIVEKLETVGKSGERVVVHGGIEEDEGCTGSLSVPVDFAEGLFLGSRLKVTR